MKKFWIPFFVLLSSCATLTLPPVGIDSDRHVGGAKAALLETEGDPHFEFTEEDTEYLLYTLHIDKEHPFLNCSAIYAVRGNSVQSVDLVGPTCHGAAAPERSVRNLVRSGELIGKSLLEAVTIFGTPSEDEPLEVEDGPGRRLVFLLVSGDTTSENIIRSGGLSVGVSLTTNCRVTLIMREGVVEEADVGGGRCRAVKVSPGLTEGDPPGGGEPVAGASGTRSHF